jgi:hypothetical protein
MSEALITELSLIGALKVISRTSVMQYKDVSKPLKQIAGELGAGAIVEGSLLREGDQVRITVQLIDARTDTHLWAQSYIHESAQALSRQRELAREVAGIIRSRIAPSDRTPLPLIEQTNAAAYEAYVKGRYFMQQQSEESWLRSRQFFEQAVAETRTSRLDTSGSRTTTASPWQFRQKKQCPMPKPARCARSRWTKTWPRRRPRLRRCTTSGSGTGPRRSEPPDGMS